MTTDAVKRKREEARKERGIQPIGQDRAPAFEEGRPGGGERFARSAGGEAAGFARLLALLGGSSPPGVTGQDAALLTARDASAEGAAFPQESQTDALLQQKQLQAQGVGGGALAESIPSPTDDPEKFPPPEGIAENAIDIAGRVAPSMLASAGLAGANVVRGGGALLREGAEAAGRSAVAKEAAITAGRRFVGEGITATGGEGAAATIDKFSDVGIAGELPGQVITEIGIEALLSRGRSRRAIAMQRLTPNREGLIGIDPNLPSEIGLMQGQGPEGGALTGVQEALPDITADLGTGRRVPRATTGGPSRDKITRQELGGASTLIERASQQLGDVATAAAERGGISTDEAAKLDIGQLAVRSLDEQFKTLKETGYAPIDQHPLLSEGDAVDLTRTRTAMEVAERSLEGMGTGVTPNVSVNAPAVVKRLRKILSPADVNADPSQWNIARLNLPETQARQFTVTQGEVLGRRPDGSEVRQHFVVDNDGNTLSKHASAGGAERQVEFLSRVDQNTNFTFEVVDDAGEFVGGFASEQSAQRFIQKSLANPPAAGDLAQHASMPEMFEIRNEVMRQFLAADDPGIERIYGDLLDSMTNDMENAITEVMGTEGVQLWQKTRDEYGRLKELAKNPAAKALFQGKSAEALFDPGVSGEMIDTVVKEIYGGVDKPAWAQMQAATFKRLIEQPIGANDIDLTVDLVRALGADGTEKFKAIYGADWRKAKQSLVTMKRSAMALGFSPGHAELTIPGVASWFIEIVTWPRLVANTGFVKRMSRLQNLKDPRALTRELERIPGSAANLGISMRMVPSADEVQPLIDRMVKPEDRVRNTPKPGQGSFGISQPQIDAASAADFADLSLRRN